MDKILGCSSFQDIQWFWINEIEASVSINHELPTLQLTSVYGCASKRGHDLAIVVLTFKKMAIA